MISFGIPFTPSPYLVTPNESIVIGENFPKKKLKSFAYCGM